MSIIVKYKWVCHGTVDCDKCAALNGQIRSLDEWFIFPGFHPNCDCSLEPVYEWANDGYQMPIISIQFQNPIWNVGPKARALYEYQRYSAPTHMITAIQAEIVTTIRALHPSVTPFPDFPATPQGVIAPPPAPTPAPRPYVPTSTKRFG